MARASTLALAMRYSEKTFEVNGAGERSTDFTPRSDAECKRVADAKPAVMNRPVTDAEGGGITQTMFEN